MVNLGARKRKRSISDKEAKLRRWTPLKKAPEAEPQSQIALPQPKTEAAKPVGFTLLGQHYPKDSWRRVLLAACTTLAARHGPSFAEAAFTVKGRTRQYAFRHHQTCGRSHLTGVRVTHVPDGELTLAQTPGFGSGVSFLA